MMLQTCKQINQIKSTLGFDLIQVPQPRIWFNLIWLHPNLIYLTWIWMSAVPLYSPREPMISVFRRRWATSEVRRLLLGRLALRPSVSAGCFEDIASTRKWIKVYRWWAWKLASLGWADGCSRCQTSLEWRQSVLAVKVYDRLDLPISQLFLFACY